MQRKIRIGVVDDHMLYRDGVIFALESEADIEVVGQGGTAADAFQIAQEHSPDVLLLDVNMPGGGINAAAKIVLRYPATRILMLTVVDDEEEVRSALRKGARGYLLKGTSSTELINAIRIVDKGQRYVSPGFAAQLFMSRVTENREPSAPSRFPEITAREEQILMLILQGFSNKRIGDELGLTEKTVKSYVTAIMEKLGVRNRVEAAMVAATRMYDKQPQS
jgi:DNA-binding NarL/FixJ family response regulator